MIRYGLVILFNVAMWGCYINSLRVLSSLQATVTNFATNFLSSGLAGFFLFEEPLSLQVIIFIGYLVNNVGICLQGLCMLLSMWILLGFLLLHWNKTKMILVWSIVTLTFAYFEEDYLKYCPPWLGDSPQIVFIVGYLVL